LSQSIEIYSSGQEYDIGSQLFQLVEINAPFYGLVMFPMGDIGKVPDYWRAIRGAATGEIKMLIFPDTKCDPHLHWSECCRELGQGGYQRPGLSE